MLNRSLTAVRSIALANSAILRAQTRSATPITATVTSFQRLASTAQDKKSITQKKKALDKLKSQLTKEKKHLSTLETKLKQRTKVIVSKEKEREKKEKEKEKKIIADATKTYRGISGYTLFVKEARSSNITDVSKQWNSLAIDEKEVYQQKAKDINEEAKKLYTPKPKRPAEGFALYLKENYKRDGRAVEEVMKELGAQWRDLSSEAKQSYKLSQADKTAYEKTLKEWTEKRVALYNETNSK